MTKDNDTLIKIKAVMAIARVAEQAYVDLDQEDVKTLSSEQKRDVAEMARLQRLADRNADEIIRDHLGNCHSADSTDRMVDLYSASYLDSLSLSYHKLSQLAAGLVGAARLYNIEPSRAWLEMAEGFFNFDEELERIRVNT